LLVTFIVRVLPRSTLSPYTTLFRSSRGPGSSPRPPASISSRRAPRRQASESRRFREHRSSACQSSSGPFWRPLASGEGKVAGQHPVLDTRARRRRGLAYVPHPRATGVELAAFRPGEKRGHLGGKRDTIARRVRVR